MFPLVRELAAAGTRSGVSVAVACRVLGFSKQAYYQWLRKPLSDRDWDEAHLINAARDVWDEDRCQGYRLITDELVDDGWQVSERRVWRVCPQEGMFSAAHRRKGRRKHRRPGPAVHDDLVNRNFTADAPNQVWLTDITEHRTNEGKVYLCAVKDGRFQGASATLLISSFSFSRGVWNSRVLRGRLLSWAAMASISSSETALKSVPFG